MVAKPQQNIQVRSKVLGDFAYNICVYNPAAELQHRLRAGGAAAPPPPVAWPHVAMPAALPVNWRAAVDSATGYTYYSNLVTGQRQWNKPVEGSAGPTWVQFGAGYWLNQRTGETRMQEDKPAVGL